MKMSAMALLLAPALAQAQTPSSFVVVLGRDTIAVERFTRTPDRLEAELTTRGLGPRLKYTLELSQGMPRVLRNAAYRGADDSTLFQSAVLTFTGDSVIAEISGNVNVTQRIKSEAGAFPFINPSFALFEPVLARARALGGTSATVPLFTVSGGQTFPVTVKWTAPDSAVITVGGVDMHLEVSADNRILGGSVPSQNLRIVRSGAAARLQTEKPDYSAPANAGYTAEEVTIKAAESTLAGTLTLPKNRHGKVPVVVTISGSGLEDRDEAIPVVSGYRPFRDIAEALAARGIGVLRYDDRGYGESKGNTATATSEDFANDVRGVLAYLRTRPDVDARNLFLLGHSEGGLIAPMVARTDPKLRGIVLLAGPARTGRRVLEYQNRYMIDQQPNLPAAQKDSLYKAALAALDSIRQPWLRFFLDYDPLTAARAVKAPVLILQGANDRQVTADQAAELAAAFKAGGNQDVTERVVPGVNHLFLLDPNGNPTGYSSLQDRKLVPVVLTTISDWIVKHVK